MLSAIKNWLRRRRLAVRGIAVQKRLETFVAGDRSGVWTVWPKPLGPRSVVYSFGVGDNLAWELAIVARFGLTVHAFDPTPASVDWVARQALPPGLVFHPVGLAGHDGIVPLVLPRRGSRFNFRPAIHSSQPSRDVVEAPALRLATHMRQLGHDRLDVLKMDIEGSEYAALDDLLASRIRIGQILVEFHHHFPNVGIERTVRAVGALVDAGYRIFSISERGLELSFALDAANNVAA